MESWLGATAAPSGPVLKIIQLKILKDPDICLASHLGNLHLAKCILSRLGQNDGHTSAQGSQQLTH